MSWWLLFLVAVIVSSAQSSRSQWDCHLRKLSCFFFSCDDVTAFLLMITCMMQYWKHQWWCNGLSHNSCPALHWLSLILTCHTLSADCWIGIKLSTWQDSQSVHILRVWCIRAWHWPCSAEFAAGSNNVILDQCGILHHFEPTWELT